VNSSSYRILGCRCVCFSIREFDSFNSVLFTTSGLLLLGHRHARELLGHTLSEHHLHHWGSYHGSGCTTVSLCVGLLLLHLEHVSLHELLLVVSEGLLLANNNLLVVLVKLLGGHFRVRGGHDRHLHLGHNWHGRHGIGGLNRGSDRGNLGCMLIFNSS
jgi:hypothetical protein